MRRVEVSPRAADEIEQAQGWWLANRPKAPEALLDDVAEAFELLAVSADAMPIVARSGIRRFYLSRVRYYLYYRIRDSEIVDILAFWHASRGSDPGI